MFVPFMLYGMTSFMFMYLKLKYLHDNGDDASLPEYVIITGLIAMIFWVYQIYLEYKQLKTNESCCMAIKDYLTDLWNINDIIHLSLVLVLVINSQNELTFIGMDT